MIPKELIEKIFHYDCTYQIKYNNVINEIRQKINFKKVIKEMKQLHFMFKDFNYDIGYHYFDYCVYFGVYFDV